MEKSVICIDWNGTLNNENFFRSLDQETYSKIQTVLFTAQKQMVVDWMKGKYTSEEVVSYLAHYLGIPFDDLWDVFVDDCMTMSIDPEIRSQIEKLKERYTVILITGNMDCFTRFTVPALNLNELFDGVYSSHESGILKDENDGEVFVTCLQKHDGSIAEAHLFDDSEMVCNIFSAHGGKAHLVTKEKPLKEQLETLLTEQEST
jgi:FMN phosphatase YigB (HAD superfamily)